MLLIHDIDDIVALQVDLDVVCAVFIVDDPLIAGRDVHVLAVRPLVVPPAGDNAHLDPVATLRRHVERFGLHPFPDISRKLGEALRTVRVGVRAFQAETILAVPVDHAVAFGIGVRPEDRLDKLPMAAAGRLLIGEFRKVDFLPVKGVKLAHPGPFENLPRDGNDDQARALAVEILILENQRIAVRIDQFRAADELQVRAIDGQLLPALNLFAILFGEA